MRQAAKDMRLPLPPPSKSVKGMDRDFVASLVKQLDGIEEREGRLTMKGSVDSAVQRALARRAARVNALEATLDAAVLRVELNAFQRREHTPKREHHDGDGKRCGRGWIAKDKICRKAVDVLSGDEPLTAQEAADALDQAPHHHLRDVLRHWFDGSYKRLNKAMGARETQQLTGLIRRIKATPVPGVLWRGVGFKTQDELMSFANAVKAGDWPNRPLNAFSHKPQVAAKFADIEGGGKFMAVLKMTGSKSGRDLRPLAEEVSPKFAHQEEVMFLDDAPIKVKRHDLLKTEQGYTFVAEVYED